MADKTGYIGRNPGDGTVTIARQSFTPSGITTEFYIWVYSRIL